MTVKDLRERVKKAQETVEKKKATIERHKAQAEKKLAVIKKHPNWDENDRYCMINTPEHHECYWAICEYESKLSDIKSATKKLAEAEQILKNWQIKLEEAEAKENCFLKEIPKNLQSYREYLVEEWDAYDKKRREKLCEEYKTLGYKDFIKKYSYNAYEFRTMTDEEIHKENIRSAESLIFDLYYRIKDKVGAVTDWKGLTISQGHINGVVIGTQGSVRVESILAGGYNIQRLHVRVLVHELKQQVNKTYSDMTIEELEQLAAEMHIVPKKYDNKGIYRMRLIMTIKAGRERS